MSPLLTVAIVLLVLVVGLTLLQRRGQTQSYQPRRDPSPPPAPPQPPEPPDIAPHDDASSEVFAEKVDPLLGAIELYKGNWTTDTDINLNGTLVLVEIEGTIDGPTHDDHEIVKAALARPDLEARARALVVAELESRHVDMSDLAAYSLSIKRDEAGEPYGTLWYATSDFLGDAGVKSTDHWQTIHLVVEE